MHDLDLPTIVGEAIRRFSTRGTGLAVSQDERPAASRDNGSPAGTPRLLAPYIDHTLLKAEARPDDIDHLCAEALGNEFASVCINTGYVSRASRLLQGSAVQVCAVIGFPLGAASTFSKTAESEHALNDGAAELDMVIQIGLLKSGDYHAVEREISAIAGRAHVVRALVKVIIETCLLTREEKISACAIAKYAGADFVKTSTGFSTGGATTADVALMRSVVGGGMGVKASGGIRTRTDALAMIRAGATRIGTSSGIAIVQEERTQR